LILKGYLRIENLVEGRIVPLFVIRIKKVAIYESSKNCYDLDNLLIGKWTASPPCLPSLCHARFRAWGRKAGRVKGYNINWYYITGKPPAERGASPR
jgi:hypothetical protein